MINLKQVATFLAVVETGSFQGAAEKLGCAQPTVSLNLKLLEEQLDVALVQRSRNGSEPTSQGIAFLPHARALLRTAERALRFSETRGLALGASSNVGTYILPSLITSLIEDDTQELELTISNNPAIADSLSHGEIDVALMEWWDDRPGYMARIWRRERLVAIAPPQHPWASLREVTREQLFGMPMIGGEPGTGTATLFRRVFGEKDTARMTVSHRLGSTEAVKAAVKAGLGVSVVIASAVKEDMASGKLAVVTLADTLEKDIFVVLPADTPSNAIAARFAQSLVGIG